MKLVISSVVMFAVGCAAAPEPVDATVQADSPLRALGIASVSTYRDGAHVEQLLYGDGRVQLGSVSYEDAPHDQVSVTWQSRRLDLSREQGTILIGVDGATTAYGSEREMVEAIGYEVPLIADTAPKLSDGAFGTTTQAMIEEIAMEESSCSVWGQGGTYWTWQEKKDCNAEACSTGRETMIFGSIDCGWLWCNCIRMCTNC